ncbi:MAG: hypothetical protein HQK69_07755 [Desulfamplus sp.]|nr:hypothetical protein [Desulfamplus sp.]
MDLLQAALFFRLRNNSSFCNPQIHADVSYSAAIDDLLLYLFFNAGAAGIIRIVNLEGFSAYLAAVSMYTALAISIFLPDQLVHIQGI